MDHFQILIDQNALKGKTVLIIGVHNIALAEKFRDNGFQDIDVLDITDTSKIKANGFNLIKAKITAFQPKKVYDLVVCIDVVPFFVKSFKRVFAHVLTLGKVCLTTFFSYGHSHDEKQFKPLMLDEVEELFDKIHGQKLLYANKDKFCIETEKEQSTPQRVIHWLTKQI